jgi:hypothetical protein
MVGRTQNHEKTINLGYLRPEIAGFRWHAVGSTSPFQFGAVMVLSR